MKMVLKVEQAENGSLKDSIKLEIFSPRAYSSHIFLLKRENEGEFERERERKRETLKEYRRREEK